MAELPYYSGDLVQLISDGPRMVVRWVAEASDLPAQHVVCCNWISASGEPHEFNFLAKQLQPYPNNDQT